MKKSNYSILIIIVFTITLLIPVATAHVPIQSGDNHSIEDALHVHNPTKSWAIYDEIHDTNQANYYELDMKSGMRLRVSVFTPDESDFSPGIVVMGPKFNNSVQVPNLIEVPEGYSAIVIASERPSESEYEPFTPSSSYRTAEFDMKLNHTGTYYIAVFEPNHTGKVGIAIGYIESFGLDEWIMIPFDVINIHLWEGQSLLQIIAPLIITIVVGLVFILWRWIKRKKGPNTLPTRIGTFTGLLYIGTGAMLFSQMGIALSKTAVTPAVSFTIIFAVIPIILGLAILKISFKEPTELHKTQRIKFLIYGILGLFLWAGLIVGPILIMLSSILPKNLKMSSQNKV